MPINVFGNSSINSRNQIDMSLFVQKPYLRTNYIEANIEEDIDLKNQYRIKNLPDPISIREAASKNYVDNIFKNDIDFNDGKLENIKFVKVNYSPAIGQHLTPKIYVDKSIDESSLVRNNKDNDFGNYNLTNINTITLNKQAENDDEVITKAYVDQLHQENERSRRDVGFDFYNESSDLVKNNQDNSFNDNKLTNINSITFNNNPTDDNQVSNKKYVDGQLDKNTIVRFNQTLQNYLKVSVGNNIYNLTRYNKIQIVDTTEIRYPNIGSDLLQKWSIKCNNKNNQSILSDFIKSTRTNSPTGNSGATILPPVGNAFMYIETSSNIHGDNVYVTWERTDIIQITNISLYYNRFSISDINLRAMGRFKNQLLLENNAWTTQFIINENDQYSNNSSDWNLINLDFTVENYGIKLVYDRNKSAHADMCFSNIMITHSVF